MQFYEPSGTVFPFQRTTSPFIPYPRATGSQPTSRSRSTSPVALRTNSASPSFVARYKPSHLSSPSKTRIISHSHSPISYSHPSQNKMPRPPLIPGTNSYVGKDGRMLDIESLRRNWDKAGHGSHQPRASESRQSSAYAQPQSSTVSSEWPRSSNYLSQPTTEPNIPPARAPPSRPVGPSSYPFTQAMYPGVGENRAIYAPVVPARAPESHGRRHWNARDYVPAAQSSTSDEFPTDPLVHNALGWWPDQPNPSLVWDLSSSVRPRYTKRELDADELAASPFTPPLARMRLVLNYKLGWAFDISARPGERNITLQGLLQDITALMRAPGRVPHAFWTRAGEEKKKAILRTMFNRTGKNLQTVPPHRRPKTMGQLMEEAVVEGAPPGYTNLLVSDLLCDDVMFWGMEFHKGPDEWVLRTTNRRWY
ncbi:hypothetical protein DFH11DRAFT_829548 [Phellopilus nigrolimitatus]|nr:hypothetical protein DFH11DRAFT_829548 [Phellopilus nigrolimitatus]